MVFGSLCHGFDLVFIEPIAQMLVFSDDATRNEVMCVAPFAESRVVVSGCGINHVFVHLVVFGQGQAAFDDLLGMIALMCSVEMVVAGQNVLLDVVD